MTNIIGQYLAALGRKALLLPFGIAQAQETVSQQAQAAPFSSFDSLGDALVFGIQVTLVGMLAVFLGLLAVFFALKLLTMKRKRPTGGDDPQAEKEAALEESLSSEVVHAIALALHLDLRTFEEDVPEEITIRKVTRPYSAWWNSGKTQMMIDKWKFPGTRG